MPRLREYQRETRFRQRGFTIDGRRVLVEHIPAQICERCGEATFSRETTEKIRRLVHGEGHPCKTVPLDVFALT